MKATVVVNKPLTSLSNGYDLRVWHLCGSLLRAGHTASLVVLPLASREAAEYADGTVDANELFHEVTEIGEESLATPAFRRHFRSSEIDYLRYAHPRFFDASLEAIGAALQRHAADRLIFFGENLAGMAAVFRDRPVILDVCDSVVLTLRRQRGGADESGLGGRLQASLNLRRWERLEQVLPGLIRLVTTISEPDSETIRQLARGARNVMTVPNGVAPELEHWRMRPANIRRGVVFWGNMAFGPNREAVRRFHDEVFAPRLAPRGIEWCIVGRNPEPWLIDEAGRNSLIRLTGFVAELYPLVSEYPVMVNPMYSGSGLKNKVLEAFALGLAVVSTQMGVEAIDGARADTHFALAAGGQAFANQVLRLLDDAPRRDSLACNARQLVTSRYTWDVIGHQWQGLCEGLS